MKWIVIAAAIGASAVVAVTASAQSAPPTKEPGKLIVGFDLPAPGFWNGRATGTTIKNPTGFEAQLSAGDRKEARHLDRRVSARPVRRLLSPAPKKYDFAFEEVTITPTRAKVVAFSTPYFDATQGVLIRKGLSPKPTKISDLKSSNPARRPSTTGLSYIQHKLRPAKKPLVYSASSTAAFDAVEPVAASALILRHADRGLAEQKEEGRLRRRRRLRSSPASAMVLCSRRAAR